MLYLTLDYLFFLAMGSDNRAMGNFRNVVRGVLALGNAYGIQRS